MRILLLGASGFIGAHTAAALRAAGHEVFSGKPDFTRALKREDWSALLVGMEAVINAVGIIRERGRRTFELVHERAPQALFDACAAAGVRRVIQISALGADDAAKSRFHRSKKRADDYLASLDLDWAIVQPSIVFGEGGASARLFALLAALPLTPLPGDGRQRLQPIHIDDLTEAIAKLASVPVKTRLAAVGPREVSVREWLRILRAQMGFGRPRFVRVPRALVPVERETLQMLERGNTAPAATVTQLLRRPPRDPREFVRAAEARALATRARLDWLLPLLRASIALVWIASGIVSLGLYPVQDSLALLARVGISSVWVLYAAAALDIALGGATLLAPKRWLWTLQIVIIIGYTAIISVYLPEFWLHPFGAVLKNLVILAALLVLRELDARR